jgi:O-Antigen ligase
MGGAAAVVFWLGYDGGSYTLQSWTKAAIVTWWTVLIGVAAGVLPRARIGRPAAAAIALMLGFATFSACSAAWSNSAEAAVTATARAVFYCGILTLVVFLCTRRSAARTSDVLALGLVAVAVLALLSRFFESVFPADPILATVPDSHTRLSYPVGYWNGLAILVALACPLLLRAALDERSPIARAAALAPFPALAAVIYLSSSRSGSITAVVGAVGLVALCRRRWQGVGALGLAFVGSIATVLFLRQQQALVDGPLGTATARHEGHIAALVVAVVSLATAASWWAIAPRLDRVEVSRSVGRIGVALLVVAVAAGVAAANPVSRWHSFTRPPAETATRADVRAHFVSSSGNWRWQYWKSAFDEWKTRPLVGRGSGSYEAWWLRLRHGDHENVVGNAHSLYAQTAGELGLVGLGLLLAAFVLGIVVGTRRALGMRGALGDTAAAATAGFAAYAVAAGIDWMWELPAVSVVGFVLLALAVGPATGREQRLPARPYMGTGLRAATSVVAIVALLLELNLLAGDLRLGDSQAAAAQGDLAAARSAARDAHRLQPWSATPYLQLALIDEQAGSLPSAAKSIVEAINRDRSDWRVWFIASRIENEIGKTGGAEAAYRMARSLNPGGSAFVSRTIPGTPPPQSLITAVHDPNNFSKPDAPIAFQHAAWTGATAARILIPWVEVAPREPSGDPASPLNPSYDWSSVDRQVVLAVRSGLEPMLDLYEPPQWAERPGSSVGLPELRNFTDIGAFARAAAERYSGKLPGLPRVHDWGVWNEPNVSYYLSPQYVDAKPVSPDIYRRMVNAFADSVHAVHRDNLVVAGDTSPFSQGDADTDPTKDNVAMAPLDFMRRLLCMSSGPTPQPTCKTTVRFDVWAHHPYTHGGPLDKADKVDNVSIGDLPAMRNLLDAAVQAGHVKSDGTVGFWVTEFSWDSKPTDPAGVPVALEAKWVAEAMYQMWKAGVSLVTWYLVHDQTWRPNSGNNFQSSLFQPGPTIAGDWPKPALASFRFPFVGHVQDGKVFVWGRTPYGRSERVLVEQLQANRWVRLGVVTTNHNGLFSRTFSAPTKGYVRARELRRSGLAAPPFPLAPLPDLHIQPFGS